VNGGLETCEGAPKKPLKYRGYLIPKVIRGKPIFDLIPEESETMSIIDPDALSTISSEEGGEEENELISRRILALEQNDLTSIMEEELLTPQEQPQHQPPPDLDGNGG
jgi:hypothetical protein